MYTPVFGLNPPRLVNRIMLIFVLIQIMVPKSCNDTQIRYDRSDTVREKGRNLQKTLNQLSQFLNPGKKERRIVKCTRQTANRMPSKNRSVSDFSSSFDRFQSNPEIKELFEGDLSVNSIIRKSSG